MFFLSFVKIAADGVSRYLGFLRISGIDTSMRLPTLRYARATAL